MLLDRSENSNFEAKGPFPPLQKFLSKRYRSAIMKMSKMGRRFRRILVGKHLKNSTFPIRQAACS